MSEIAEKEKSFNIMFSETTNISESEVFQAKIVVQSFVRTRDGLVWLINNYPSFSNPNSRYLTFKAISYWYRDKESLITEDMNDTIKSLVFDKILSTYDLLTEKCQSAYMESLVLFSLYNYSSSLGEFLSFIITQKANIIVGYFEKFSEELNIVSPGRLSFINGVKQAIKESESQSLCLSMTLSIMQNGDPIGYKILSNFAKWCDTSVFEDAGLIQQLQSGLGLPNTASYTIDIFSTMIVRISDTAIKGQLISFVGDIDTLTSLVEQFSDQISVHEAIARLIYSIGLISFSDDFYSFALQLLGLSENVILIISNFLVSALYSKINTEFDIKPTFEAALSRIIEFFNSENFSLANYSTYENTISCLLKVLLSCYFQNNDNVIQILLEYLEILNPIEDPAGTSSVILVLIEIFGQSTSNYRMIDQFLEVFPSFFSIDGTMENPYIFEFFIFSKLASKFPDRMASAMVQLVFDVFIRVLSSDSYKPEIKKMLMDPFIVFLKPNIKKIEISHDLIEPFMSSNDPDFVCIGSLFIFCFNETKTTQISRFISEMIQNYNISTSDISKKTALQCALTFLKMQQSSVANELENIVKQFLESVFESCINDDDLLALFIHGCANSLKDASYLSQYASYCMGPQSIASFCYQTSQLHKLSNNIDQIWASDTIDIILGRFVDLIEGSQALKLSSIKLDDACLAFAEMIKILIKYTREETYGRLFEFFRSQFERPIESVVSYEAIILVLAALADVVPDQVVEFFGPMSFSIVFCPFFDPNNYLWKKVLSKLRTLINRLNFKSPDALQASFEQCCSILGIDTNLGLTYFHDLEGPSIKKANSERLFFQSLIQLRQSQ